MSYQIKISPRKRKAARFISGVRSELQKAFDEQHNETGLTQTELANTLGVSRSVVSKRLNGRQNLTLRSIADFAWALDKEIVFRLVEPMSAATANTIVLTRDSNDITASVGFHPNTSTGGPEPYPVDTQ